MSVREWVGDCGVEEEGVYVGESVCEKKIVSGRVSVRESVPVRERV